MKFPYFVSVLTKEESDLFTNNYISDGKFYLEGMWFREQKKDSSFFSVLKDSDEHRRKYFHFYDCYQIVNKDDKDYLSLTGTYMYLSKTSPTEEIEAYYNKISDVLEKNEYKKKSKYNFFKDDLEVKIVRYYDHPKDIEFDNKFPSNYESIDVVIRTDSYDYIPHYERMWKISNFENDNRITESEKPKFTKNIQEIIKLLPAQIEVGCDLSLDEKKTRSQVLNDIYKVEDKNNKISFDNKDDFVLEFLEFPIKTFKSVTTPLKECIKNSNSKYSEIISSLYSKDVFVGDLLNNNFERIVTKYDVIEKEIRNFNLDEYIPEVDFDKKAKSLISIGVTSDRRKIQKQAREKGLKVIYIDADLSSKRKTNIEGVKKNDLVYKGEYIDFLNELKEYSKTIKVEKDEEEKE